jgi:hypothetical protein
MALNEGSREEYLGLRRTVRTALLALLAAVLAWEGRAEACSVPVFRYALERFPSDPYEFVIFHRGPLSAEHKQEIAATEKLAEDTNWPVNLKVRLVDLAAKLPQKPDPAAKESQKSDPTANEVQKPAWTPPPNGPLPWFVVAPPGGGDTHVWSGRLRADDIRALVDSPARREVAHRLMQGDSAVFLFLESGQKEADVAAAQTLQTTLAKMEKSLQLPADDGTGRVESELPLKISFSILRIGRSDPAERGLVKILSGSSDGAQHNPGPIVYPVFGRGRILAALSGEMLTPDALQEVGEFLCGSCSCSLKGQLPGGDLLMAAAWDTILQGGKISEDSPALQGLGPLVQAAAAAEKKAAAVAEKKPPAAASSSIPLPLADPPLVLAQQEPPVDPPRHGMLVVSLLATLAVAIALVAAGSILLRNRMT